MRIVVLDGGPLAAHNAPSPAFPLPRGGSRPRDVWSDLRELGDVTVFAHTLRDEVTERCRDAIVVLTNKVPVDAEIMAQLPDLRYIGVIATGTNIVDLDAARERNIAVTNVPGYSSESVAQHVFALILHLTHNVAAHNDRVKAGDWSRRPDFSFTVQPLIELNGKTLVVIGAGAIGGAVLRIGAGFGMQTIAAQVPGRDTPGRTPLANALPLADFVSLHCPLTPATERMANEAFLSQLKPGAVLINTSRGQLVDETALIAALASGRLAAAALDVLSKEPPPPDHPLLSPNAAWADRLIVTPHIGWSTVEAQKRLVSEVVKNLEAFLLGERRNRVA